MAKVDIELVAEVLANESKIEKPELDRIVRLLTRAAEKAADEVAAAKEPTSKKQPVLLISDPEGKMPDEDLVGWILQIPENDPPYSAPERLIKAAHTYNLTRRGQKYPVKSIGEACEVVGAKHLKEMLVAVKTRLPVTVLRTDNVLPPDRESAISLQDLRTSP